MEPLALLPAYQNETVANTDRAAPDGFAPDPRNAERRLLCRTRYARDPVHEIRIDPEGRVRKIRTGDLLDTSHMFPGVRGWDVQRRDGRALFTVAVDGTIHVGCGTSLGLGVREYVQSKWRPDKPVYVPDVLELWHHSSFVDGAPVLCAGELGTTAKGHVWYVSNFSGHYRPGVEHLLAFVERLAADGVDMARVTVEVVTEDPNAPNHCVPAARFLAARGVPPAEPPPVFTGRY
jgi:hypothetical protein